MNRKGISIFVLFAYLIVSPFVSMPPVDALEVDTHEIINEKISSGNLGNFLLGTYLVDHLSISGGVNELLDGKTVSRWIRDGGRYEDIPEWYLLYLRSINHFHNPLTEQGFGGFVYGKFLSGVSLIEWAQKPSWTQSPGGYYSWYDVRRYFYDALTATGKVSKEKNFADMFRGLGQLMHLVQDASVPDHTRDQFHVGGYEIWVKKNLGSIPTGSIFNKSIFDRPTSGLPIANIFDTNQYEGTNPDVTGGANIGLAEYTNANFFSDLTINSGFPYPKIDITSYVERQYLSVFGTPYMRQYYLKNCCGETKGGQGYLLSAVDYLDYWRKKVPLGGGMNKIPVLDSNVYRDYASLLIPRAVGYSAGLLEYFFRGKLQVTSLPIFSQNGIYIMRVKIKNITPTQETMKNGWFTLSYRYTPTGSPLDGSEDVFGQTTVCSSNQPCEELSFEGEKTFDFVLPNSIPIENYDSVKFTLAFKGTLGNEEGAVIGKAFIPGEIKFNEEWDKGLTGNHAWGHVDFGTSIAYTGHGQTSNTIQGDTLIKENIRYVGKRNPTVNASFVGEDLMYFSEFKDILPIPITPNTYLQFKIDQMSINEIPPSQPGTTAHYQGLWLIFNNGLVLQLTHGGQGVNYSPLTAIWYFDLGTIYVENIYKLFQDAGITIPDGDLYLRKIEFVQQLFTLEEPSTVEHKQHMEVDFIRIIEEKQQ